LRGRETSVTCDSCGRKVPRNKAVDFDKAISYSTDLHNSNDVRFFERRRVYYCISCAKHRGIFERKKEMAARQAAKRA
jgi:ribosomal protein S26